MLALDAQDPELGINYRGDIIVYNLRSQKLSAKLPSSTCGGDGYSKMAFSPTEKYLAYVPAGEFGDRIAIFDLEAQKEDFVLEAGPCPITALAFHHSGTKLAAKDACLGHITLWDLKERRAEKTFSVAQNMADTLPSVSPALLFSGDGALLAMHSNVSNQVLVNGWSHQPLCE